MGDPEFRQKLRDYLIRNFREIEHPADPPYDVSRRVIVDIENTADALLALLRLPTTVPEAQDLERRVLSSFGQYLSATEVETERRVHAVSNTEMFKEFEPGMGTREKLLDVFVDTGLLKSRDTDFAFRNDTVKAYFAAVGLRSRMRRRKDVEQVLSLIRQVNDFWYRCVGLLKQMDPLNDFSHVEKHLASLAKA